MDGARAAAGVAMTVAAVDGLLSGTLVTLTVGVAASGFGAEDATSGDGRHGAEGARGDGGDMLGERGVCGARARRSCTAEVAASDRAGRRRSAEALRIAGSSASSTDTLPVYAKTSTAWKVLPSIGKATVVLAFIMSAVRYSDAHASTSL